MNPTPEPQKISVLAIAALVFAFLCFPLGLILGVVAIVKIKRSNGQLGGMILAILAVIFSGFVILPTTGVLAAIAIPNYLRFECRAKQSEAKMILKQLYVAEESHRAEFDIYEADLSKLDYYKPRENPRYQINVLSASDNAFVIEATTTDPAFKDTWTIDQDNALTNVVPGC